VKFSIVTPTLNQAAFLRQTLQSILSQQGDFELESIVIDGGSTDGTIELLRSISDPRLRWISEPDRGQAHAINKGLAMCTGDVQAWLNSDDLYLPGALEAVRRAFDDSPLAEWVVGRCSIIDACGREIRHGVTRYKDRSLRRYTYRKLLRENFISQPAVFWRRELELAVARPGAGLLEESLHYTMDYDLWLRFGGHSDPRILDTVTSQFRLHESSKSGQVMRRQFDEQYAVACRYFGEDRRSRLIHRINVEKIVWAYRVMRWLRI
jgi:glycosyltransferase involved in cell wall biosynthesis